MGHLTPSPHPHRTAVSLLFPRCWSTPTETTRMWPASTRSSALWCSRRSPLRSPNPCLPTSLAPANSLSLDRNTRKGDSLPWIANDFFLFPCSKHASENKLLHNYYSVVSFLVPVCFRANYSRLFDLIVCSHQHNIILVPVMIYFVIVECCNVCAYPCKLICPYYSKYVMDLYPLFNTHCFCTFDSSVYGQLVTVVIGVPITECMHRSLDGVPHNYSINFAAAS